MINWIGEGEAVAIGALDKYLQDEDATAGRTGTFKGYSDYLRIALTAVGLGAGAFMPRLDKFTEPIALVGTALLTQSIYKAAKGAAGIASSRVAYTPTSRPAGRPAAQRWPAPEYQSQMQGINLV